MKATVYIAAAATGMWVAIASFGDITAAIDEADRIRKESARTIDVQVREYGDPYPTYTLVTSTAKR